MNDTERQYRDEAEHWRIPWKDVKVCADEMLRQALIGRQSQDEARKLAFASYCHWMGKPRNCKSFWSIGFECVFDKLDREGKDYTAIPHYDQIAESVAEQLPEWNDKCDELWQFLSEQHKPIPKIENFYKPAMEKLTYTPF